MAGLILPFNGLLKGGKRPLAVFEGGSAGSDGNSTFYTFNNVDFGAAQNPDTFVVVAMAGQNSRDSRVASPEVFVDDDDANRVGWASDKDNSNNAWAGIFTATGLSGSSGDVGVSFATNNQNIEIKLFTLQGYSRWSVYEFIDDDRNSFSDTISPTLPGETCVIGCSPDAGSFGNITTVHTRTREDSDTVFAQTIAPGTSLSWTKSGGGNSAVAVAAFNPA